MEIDLVRHVQTVEYIHRVSLGANMPTVAAGTGAPRVASGADTPRAALGAGMRDVPLYANMPGRPTPQGERQAVLLANFLQTRQYSAAYTSPLPRAMDTAWEILKWHSLTPTYLVPELKEVHLGSDEGQREAFAKYWGDPAPDAESKEELQERAARFLRMAWRRHADGRILLVGHKGINMALDNVLHDGAPVQIKHRTPQSHAALSEYTIANWEDHLQCIDGVVNCTNHLGDASATDGGSH